MLLVKLLGFHKSPYFSSVDYDYVKGVGEGEDKTTKTSHLSFIFLPPSGPNCLILVDMLL